MTTITQPNIYLKKISIAELKKISSQILEDRQKQYLGRIGLINLDNFVPEQNIKVKDNFVFEIQKLFGITKKALNIINNFPFKDLLVDLKKSDWDKNSKKDKATFFYHFISTQKPPEDREQILEAIVNAFGESNTEFTPTYIDSVADKDIPIRYYRDQPEAEPERRQSTELSTEFPSIRSRFKEIQPEVQFEKSFESAQDHPTTPRQRAMSMEEGVVEEVEPNKKYNINYSQTKKPIVVNIKDGNIRDKALFNRLSNLAKNDFEIDAFLLRFPYAPSTQKTQKKAMPTPMPMPMPMPTIGLGIKKVVRKKRVKGGNMVDLSSLKNLNKLSKKDLVNELAVLVGSKMAGNNSVVKDINNLLDHMKKVKVITLNEYKKFKKL